MNCDRYLKVSPISKLSVFRVFYRRTGQVLLNRRFDGKGGGKVRREWGVGNDWKEWKDPIYLFFLQFVENCVIENRLDSFRFYWTKFLPDERDPSTLFIQTKKKKRKTGYVLDAGQFRFFGRIIRMRRVVFKFGLW